MNQASDPPAVRASMRGVLLRSVLVVLLPLLAVQAVVYAAWYYTRWSGQQQATAETAREAAATFEAYVLDVRRQELAMGTALTGPYAYSVEEGCAFLAAAGRGYSSVSDWSWTDPEGKVIASTNAELIGSNLADEDYFQALRNGRSWVVSNLLTDEGSSDHAFVIANRIDDPKGVPFGVVVASVEAANLGNRAIVLRHTVGEAVTVFDRQGVLVYNSQTGHNAVPTRDWQKADPLLAGALRNGAPQSGVIVLPADGTRSVKYLAACVPIQDIGWVAGAYRPVAHAMASVYRALWVAGGLNLLVAIGSALFALRTSGTLIRQLRRLQSHADAITRGELTHHTDGVNVRELTQVATALNQMGEAVRDAQEAREAANAAMEQRVRDRTAELAETIRRLEETERELQAASLYARGLIEASLDPLVTISPEGKITDVNRATEGATGLPREKLVGSDFSDYFTEPERAREGYRKVLAEGLVRDYPLTLRHISGHVIEVLYHAAVYRNQGGEVEGVFAAARDVTERRRAERELEQYRAHLEELVQQRTEELQTSNRQLEREIAERKLASEEIDRLATFPKLNPNPITEVDLQGEIHYLNPAAEQVFPDLMRQGLAHPWLADWQSLAVAVKNGDEQARAREVMVGNRCYHQALYYRAETERVRVYGLDITDRKRAEEALRRVNDELEIRVQQRTTELHKTTEALRAERQRFNDVLDMLPAYVVLLTPDYHVPFANRFFEERFGASGGRRCFEYLFGRSEPCEICETFTVLKTNAPHRWEWTGPDGRHYDISDFPFTDADGAGLILEMGIDVTERKQAEAEVQKYRHHLEDLVQQRTNQLAAANAQLQAVFDVVNVGMLLLDEHGSVQRVNNAVSRWVGKTLPASERNQPGDIIGCANAMGDSAGCGLTTHCHACPIRKAFESVLESGKPVHDVETEAAVAVDGNEVRLWLEVSADPLVLDGKQHVILAMSNITARKQAEESLKRAAEQLARSNEELEQFAYVASHDLQEPLRVVNGYVQLIDRKYKSQLDADADQFLRYIVDGVSRMQQLITDLLNYSRVGTHGKPLQATDVRAVVDRVLGNLRSVIDETGAVVTYDSLPSVHGDETQLVQLFQNLISNGIKFRSERPPRIDISAQRDDHQWTFAVRDNGIGIESQYWEQIFVIFQRLHTRQKYAGTGIGLAICKRIVERHGGRIWLDSQPGEGTTFYFTLS